MSTTSERLLSGGIMIMEFSLQGGLPCSTPLFIFRSHMTMALLTLVDKESFNFTYTVVCFVMAIFKM